ncbi:hypothetical protein GL50803_0095693 [Giardia duodenalis]|uniref:Uncharacterized protein n=1 Tax=Giardia intestinalis (strain ATCC 50803 / WB clone C6) TaxID=184922 RepID=A8B2K6_GIAIC|nr:hypothetical protein GL50803_0095693 [Giardia intestinalis]KAE8302998.1 hypothetical protein GL50803_0095693 [Giardia intestinalis]|eukprot:XP_001709994.1 Hypothetical protein GL50803_95693 [Giardia lamblia ATCC 50803]
MSCNGIVSVSRILGHDYDDVNPVDSPEHPWRRRVRGHCGILPPVESTLSVAPFSSNYGALSPVSGRFSRACFRNMGDLFDPSTRMYADRLSSFVHFGEALKMDPGVEVTYYSVDAPVTDLISRVYDPTSLWSDLHYKAGRRHYKLGEYSDEQRIRNRIPPSLDYEMQPQHCNRECCKHLNIRYRDESGDRTSPMCTSCGKGLGTFVPSSTNSSISNSQW